MPKTTPAGISGFAAPSGYADSYSREPNPALRYPFAQGDATTIGIYDEMTLTDPVVASCVAAVALPIAQAPWEINAPEGYPEEILECVRKAFFEDLRPSLSASIREWVAAMITNGCHPTEPVFRILEDGSATLGTLAPRPVWTIRRWHLSPAGDLESVTQEGPGADGIWTTVGLQASELAIFTHGRRGTDPRGSSMLRPIYFDLKIKQHVKRLIGVRNEREALGLPIIHYPEGATPETRLEVGTMVAQYRAHERAYLMVPVGWEVDLPEGKAGSADAMRGDLAALNLEILTAFLLAWQALGQSGSTSGGRAVGEVQAEPFYLAALSIAGEVIEPLDHLIEQLVIYNFGPQEVYPAFAVPKIRAEDVTAAITPLLEAIAKGGLTRTPDVEARIREVTGLPPLPPEIAARQLEEAIHPPPPPQQIGPDGKPIEPPPGKGGPRPGPKGGGKAPPKGDGDDKEGKNEGKGLGDDPAPVLLWHPSRMLSQAEERVAFAEIDARLNAAPSDLQGRIGNAIRGKRGPIVAWLRPHARALLEGREGAALRLAQADLPKAIRAAIVAATAGYARDLHDFGRAQAERERLKSPAVAEREARAAAAEVRESIPEAPDVRGLFADPPPIQLLPSMTVAESGIAGDRIADELLRLVRLATTRAAATAPRARAPDGSRAPFAALGHVLEEIERTVTFSSESMGIVRDSAQALSVRAFAGGRDEVFREHESEIASVDYSALLDAAVCDACASEHGTSAPSLAAADDGAIAPVPNPACEGGIKCRCIHVVTYH